MSHTIVLCLSWVGGAVCINVYEIQGSHSGGNPVVVFWVVIQCARWLPKLQRNTLPSTLNIDTACCSIAFVPTFQTTQYHKLAIPQCQYLYIYVVLGAEMA